MAASKPFEFAHTVLIFLALIGVCVWVGMIVAAKGESRLQQACKPVEFTTTFINEVTFALVGTQPTWTLYLQRYLMTGCYYFFSVVFSEKLDQGLSNGGGLSSGSGMTTGGIQQ